MITLLVSVAGQMLMLRYSHLSISGSSAVYLDTRNWPTAFAMIL